MLQENEINKIIGLIKQKKTNYRIWKETGYSVNTIDKIRKNRENTETTQTQEKDIPYINPIDKTRRMIANLETFIQTEQLNDRERKQLEKLLEKLKEIIRVEVDDRILLERADAVGKRDQEWIKIVEQNYVKKEVATGLKSTIRERERRPSRVSGM